MISTTHKMAILGDIYAGIRSSNVNDENWNTFFNNNDIAFPFSFLYSLGFCEHSKNFESREFIEEKIAETWIDLCSMLNLDPMHNWQTASHMFDATENYFIVQFDEETEKEIEGLIK